MRWPGLLWQSQGRRHEVGLQPPCFDAGELKQRVDEFQQTKRIAMSNKEALAVLPALTASCEKVVDMPEH